MERKVQDCRNELLNLNDTAFKDITKHHLEPLLLTELGINKFSNTAVLATSTNPISKQKNSLMFNKGNFSWTLHRLRKTDGLPYVADYALNFRLGKLTLIATSVFLNSSSC